MKRQILINLFDSVTFMFYNEYIKFNKEKLLWQRKKLIKKT